MAPSELQGLSAHLKITGGKTLKKMSLSQIQAQLAFTGTQHQVFTIFTAFPHHPPIQQRAEPEGCWRERCEIENVHVKLPIIFTVGFWSFNPTSQGPISSTYFYKRSHQSSRKIKVGNVWHQTGIIMVHVRGALSPHVRRLPVKSMWGRPEIRVLWPSPGRMLADSRMRQSVTRVMMRRSNFCTEWEG